MAHTRAWNEARPAGSDLISSGDNTIREQMVDKRERMALDHVWAASQDHDGKHMRVTLRPANDTDEIVTELPASTTGAGVTGLMNLARTWNTTGVAKLVKITLTNTASGAGSLFLDFLIGGTNLLSLGVDGLLNLYDNVLKRPSIQDYSEVKTAPSIATETLTLNCENGNVFEVLVDDDITTFTISNWPATGKKGSIEVWFKGNGTIYTQDWGSTRWPADGAPTLSSINGDYSVITFHTFDGGTTVFGMLAASSL